MSRSLEDVWADSPSQEQIEAIIRQLPPLDSEMGNVSLAAIYLREFAWAISDEDTPEQISQGNARKQMSTLRQLCDKLRAHILSMHELALEPLVYRYFDYWQRESVTKKRLRIEGEEEWARNEKLAQEEYERHICPSPFEIAEQLTKLSKAAADGALKIPPTRTGRPRKPGAHLVALEAAKTYELMTGRPATVTTDTVSAVAGGSFLSFLKEILPALRIDASAEALARRVARQRRKGQS